MQLLQTASNFRLFWTTGLFLPKGWKILQANPWSSLSLLLASLQPGLITSWTVINRNYTGLLSAEPTSLPRRALSHLGPVWWEISAGEGLLDQEALHNYWTFVPSSATASVTRILQIRSELGDGVNSTVLTCKYMNDWCLFKKVGDPNTVGMCVINLFFDLKGAPIAINILQKSTSLLLEIMTYSQCINSKFNCTIKMMLLVDWRFVSCVISSFPTMLLNY